MEIDNPLQVLTHEKKKIRKASVIVQPAVPNNSNSLPRTTDEMGKIKKEIVSVATKEEPEKPKVDTGYGKDIKGISTLDTILTFWH